MKDGKVCPICKELEGYTWTFLAGTDSLQAGFLEHPTYGIVWDSVRGSEAHGHKGNCRCHISFIVEMHDLLARVESIHETVQARLNGIEGAPLFK